jgi:hypothetical protein
MATGFVFDGMAHYMGLYVRGTPAGMFNLSSFIQKFLPYYVDMMGIIGMGINFMGKFSVASVVRRSFLS